MRQKFGPLSAVMDVIAFVVNFAANVEPVVVSGAVTAGTALIVSARSGHMDIGVALAAVTALSSLLARARVWSQRSHDAAMEQAAPAGQ